jgi:hypothetical protein
MLVWPAADNTLSTAEISSLSELPLTLRLIHQPNAVVEELTGRLNRGLGGATEIPL